MLKNEEAVVSWLLAHPEEWGGLFASKYGATSDAFRAIALKEKLIQAGVYPQLAQHHEIPLRILIRRARERGRSVA